MFEGELSNSNFASESKMKANHFNGNILA